MIGCIHAYDMRHALHDGMYMMHAYRIEDVVLCVVSSFFLSDIFSSKRCYFSDLIK